MKYSISALITLLLLSPLSVFGQEKVSNKAFRTMKAVFTIHSQQTDKAFELLESSDQQFQFKILEKTVVKSTHKVDSTTAEAIDDDFVKQFISMKYMMPAYEAKKCSITYILTMRGESLSVCLEDSSRLTIIEKILEKISKIIS